MAGINRHTPCHPLGSRRDLARLESTLAKLQRWRFGRRSEQLSKDQISLWQEALDTEIAVIESTLEAVLDQQDAA